MASLKSIIIPAVRNHTATVILAHGLGDSGEGWSHLAESWQRQKRFEEIKFIFPNAPSRPITVNMGMSMPAWYDILNFSRLNDSKEEDETGILNSRAYFHNLIATEISSGIPSERIVLGGFSQGGAISIFSGITNPTKLGGIFGLSCYMLIHDKIGSFVEEVGNINKDTKILMAHGNDDQLVKTVWGKMTADLLKSMGFHVNLKLYPNLAHSTNSQEIDDLANFIEEIIPSISDKANPKSAS